MKIIEWFKTPKLPEIVCLTAGKGHDCAMCWPCTLGILSAVGLYVGWKLS